MYKIILKHILFPAYLAKNKNKMLKRLDMLEKSQWLSAEEIQNIQLERFKKLLTHSYNNVPFYKEKLDKVKLHPNDFTSLKQLKEIPYLSKSDLQKSFEELRARNYSKEDLILDSSGGSTGVPTNFYKDVDRWKLRRADQIRHDRWTGWDIGERMVYLWGAPRDSEVEPSMKEKIIAEYLYRYYEFNAFDISEEKMSECLNKLIKIKPTIIIAYANMAYLFAKFIEKEKFDLKNMKLKGIVSSAETLSEEKQNFIESVFNCKVLNRYGSREVGLIASECRKQEGMHINAENVIVEIEKNGKPVKDGELGEIIVTDLWNYGMPLIRYRMGDLAVKSSMKLCSCGRGLPLISNVKGRTSDFIIDSNGGLIHGEYFTHLFYEMPSVKQFQFIQETREDVRLMIYAEEGFDKSKIDEVYKKISIVLGEKIKVKVQYTDKPLTASSGKFRFTISKISTKYFEQ